MRYRVGVAAVALLLTTGVAGSAPERTPVFVPQTPPNIGMNLQKLSPEPRATELRVGEPAPMFSYLSTDGRWHKFGELLDDRPVLLVFGARTGELEGLQNARPIFDEMGLILAVALDMPAGSAASLAKRLKLDGPIISDPKRAIGSLYHTLDRHSLGHAPAYFLVDSKRTLRAMGYGTVPSPPQLIAISARGLGKALPRSAWKLSDVRPQPQLPVYGQH